MATGFVTMKSFYFLPFVAAVFAAVLSAVQTDGFDPKDVLIPCNVHDLDCLKKSTEKFLKATYKGIPEVDIVAIDPLIIPAKDLRIDGEDVVYENRNVIVKGLKDQKLEEYKMDLKAKSVLLTTGAELTIDSDVTALDKSGKRATGHSSARGSVLASASYNYKLRTDSKGVEYFDLGEETVSCKFVSPPTVQFSANLERPHSSEAALALSSHSHPDENFCSIVKTAFRSVVHNIRAAGKMLPASAFFKNLH